ncbi:iron-sulfur cluster biosynthesis family protein [Pseudoneobacillus sp. C159]
MFTITEAAHEELQNRLKTTGLQLVRLQMRKSCFMKIKITIEESVQTNDVELEIDGFHVIIDKGECHYFRKKIVDFLPDHTGFKQFEIIG